MRESPVEAEIRSLTVADLEEIRRAEPQPFSLLNAGNFAAFHAGLLSFYQANRDQLIGADFWDVLDAYEESRPWDVLDPRPERERDLAALPVRARREPAPTDLAAANLDELAREVAALPPSGPRTLLLYLFTAERPRLLQMMDRALRQALDEVVSADPIRQAIFQAMHGQSPLSPTAMASLGWVRVDPRPWRKTTARWKHTDGWTLIHCGHPTAHYPWALYDPQGRMHTMGFVAGAWPTHNMAWPSLRAAVYYVRDLGAAAIAEMDRVEAIAPEDVRRDGGACELPPLLPFRPGGLVHVTNFDEAVVAAMPGDSRRRRADLDAVLQRVYDAEAGFAGRRIVPPVLHQHPERGPCWQGAILLPGRQKGMEIAGPWQSMVDALTEAGYDPAQNPVGQRPPPFDPSRLYLAPDPPTTPFRLGDRVVQVPGSLRPMGLGTFAPAPPRGAGAIIDLCRDHFFDKIVVCKVRWDLTEQQRSQRRYTEEVPLTELAPQPDAPPRTQVLATLLRQGELPRRTRQVLEEELRAAGLLPPVDPPFTMRPWAMKHRPGWERVHER